MKKTILIICNLLVLLLLTGCFGSISKEERKLGEKAEKESILMIQDHFKNKYAIDVDVASVAAKYSGCAHDSDRCFSGVVNATVTYNDEEFSVEVYNQMVYDKYQAEEIEQACFNYALEKLNLPQPVLYKISPQIRYVNDYFDGTNTEMFFNMISPDILMIYDDDIVFDSTFQEKLAALFGQTKYAKQSMELVVLKKGSADKVSLKAWTEYTARSYAPYVEYSINYRKNENMEPEMHNYPLEPFPSDQPIFKEFLAMRSEVESGNLVSRQEEPAQEWDLGSDLEQIIPSCHLLWDDDKRGFRYIFIPSSVWKELYETYDEVYLIRRREYASGEISDLKDLMKPDDTGYSRVTLQGEYFYSTIDHNTSHIALFGIRK